MLDPRRVCFVVGAVGACAVLLFPGRAALAQAPRSNAPPPIAACIVDRNRELMIRDVSVVDDCARTTWGPCPSGATGAWTFGKLIAGVAGTNDPAALSNFVLAWLGHWERNVTVNGFNVPARTNIRSLVIDPWLRASGNGRLDMTLAPFRLLAIVNRLDLRRQSAYGNGNSGEARFVFGVLDIDNPSAIPPFTVIFEYGIQGSTCTEIKAWAQRWHALGSIPFGENYNAALQSITDTFTRIGANRSKPNGSAINQIRTNEIALDGPWQLREFTLTPSLTTDQAIVPLTQTTVKLTPNHSDDPREDLLGSRAVAEFINEFENEIIAGTYDVPALYQGQPFLGAATINNIDFWNTQSSPPIHSNEARHLFSLNTCNGCHGAEAGTDRFLQVFPRPSGTPSRLAGFLTGIDVTDPFDLTTVRHFDDLQRRVDDLCHVLNTACNILATEAPLNRTH